MVMTDPDRRRRLLSLALLGVITVLAGLGALWANRAVDASAAIRKGNDIAGCRAEYRSALDDAQARASTLFLRGLAAVAAEDDAALAEMVTPVDGVTPVDHALGQVEDASATYRAALRLSRTDQDQFLEDCEALRDR